MTEAPSLLHRASDILYEHRSASAALLQRHLEIGYGEAMKLLAQLASIGLVEAPNPLGRYRFRSNVLLELSQTAEERHARLLRDLALYLLECRGGADTRCVQLILHPLACDMSALSNAAAQVAADNPEPVWELAKALAALAPLVPTDSPAWNRALEVACRGERPLPHHLDGTAAERLHNSLVRAVRYLEKRMYDGWGPHSRCLEYFVPDALLPQGRGLEGNPTHREHVVPCVLLCEEATQMLKHAIAVDEVAKWIEPYLRIVCIDPQFAAKMDVALRLKTTMPQGWAFGRGCIYARLHEADILFTPPEPSPVCVCGWTIDRHL